jgi:acyl-coenzyme A synthetase/AMP-(fatty) acid ligase/thioesterase domain-containing protein/acyl carrier protein
MSDARSDWAGPALSWSDRSCIPLDWNGPADRPFDAFPDGAKVRPIIELLEAMVHRYPERMALADPDASITYAELWRAVAGWAEQIAEATADGDLVGILAPPSTTFPIAMLACLAAGRPFVALDSSYPSEWITRVLDDSCPSLLLIAAADPGAVACGSKALRTLDLNGNAPQAAASWRPARLGCDEAACVLFTSGSTGEPKGIVNSQRNLLQRVAHSVNAAHVNCHDRFLTLASLCTIVGVRDLITALAAGACFYLHDSREAGAREILSIVRERRISILFGFPALLRSVVEGCQAFVGEDLRLVRVGGDTMLWSDIALLRAWVSPGTLIQLVYAATEGPMMQWFVGEKAPGDEERIPIGYPLPGNALAVVDENGAPTRRGDVGELLVRSPYVALGTWSRGRCELDAIRTDPKHPNVRIFETGDLVRCRPDGFYERIGRKDRQIKIRGVRVELDGVEAAIRPHVSVRDVAVVARTDGKGGAGLVAYIQLHDTASQDCLGELKLMMRRTVPAHMRPWRYYAVPAIPRLLNSKLDGHALRAMDVARETEEADSRLASPDSTFIEKDPVEIAVAHIWRNVLGLRLAAAGDDFFDLGGDSLRAITMVVALEKALGREVPMNLINQAPTFAGFCATLRENAPAGYSALVVLKPGQGVPPLFFIHGVGGSVMELFALARKMTWSGPVIGVQARGLDGRDTPHKTVEAMTDEYLTAVKTRQPKGPYFLCGYSFGGLVAFEMARRLSDGGEDVAFVGLVATLPPGHRFLRLWAWTAYLYRRLAQGMVAVTHGRTQLLAVAVSALAASAAYRPCRYAGELTIFEPGRRDLGLPSSAIHWSRHAHALRRHRLQGRHDDMLAGANAAAAARLLTRCLEASQQYRVGSAMPAATNPAARNRQESHLPQAAPSVPA